jgi:hypothetical protein
MALTFGALVIAAVLIMGSDRTAAQDLPGRDNLAFELVRTDDKIRLPLDEEIPGLATNTVLLETGDSLRALLLQRGIMPDADAYGVIYMMNPDLDPKNLRPGSQVRLPWIDGGNSVKNALERGHLVSITMDSGLKRDVRDSAGRVNSSYASFAELPDARYPNESAAFETRNRADHLNQWLNTVRVRIEEKSRPLNQEMLMQIQGETQLFESIITSSC